MTGEFLFAGIRMVLIDNKWTARHDFGEGIEEVVGKTLPECINLAVTRCHQTKHLSNLLAQAQADQGGD